MKNYFLWLFKAFLLSVGIVWVFGVLILMMKEFFTIARAFEILPSSVGIACMLFVGISAFDVWDFWSAAKRHEVPMSWVIRAKYDLGWDFIDYIYAENFRERFLAETEDRK
jgi:hypothetical protein